MPGSFAQIGSQTPKIRVGEAAGSQTESSLDVIDPLDPDLFLPQCPAQLGYARDPLWRVSKAWHISCVRFSSCEFPCVQALDTTESSRGQRICPFQIFRISQPMPGRRSGQGNCPELSCCAQCGILPHELILYFTDFSTMNFLAHQQHARSLLAL